jgi:hypothetical protein
MGEPLIATAIVVARQRKNPTVRLGVGVPIQSAKNCLKRFTGRLQAGKNEVRGPEQIRTE